MVGRTRVLLIHTAVATTLLVMIPTCAQRVKDRVNDNETPRSSRSDFEQLAHELLFSPSPVSIRGVRRDAVVSEAGGVVTSAIRSDTSDGIDGFSDGKPWRIEVDGVVTDFSILPAHSAKPLRLAASVVKRSDEGWQSAIYWYADANDDNLLSTVELAHKIPGEKAEIFIAIDARGDALAIFEHRDSAIWVFAGDYADGMARMRGTRAFATAGAFEQLQHADSAGLSFESSDEIFVETGLERLRLIDDDQDGLADRLTGVTEDLQTLLEVAPLQVGDTSISLRSTPDQQVVLVSNIKGTFADFEIPRDHFDSIGRALATVDCAPLQLGEVIKIWCKSSENEWYDVGPFVVSAHSPPAIRNVSPLILDPAAEQTEVTIYGDGLSKNSKVAVLGRNGRAEAEVAAYEGQILIANLPRLGPNFAEGGEAILIAGNDTDLNGLYFSCDMERIRVRRVPALLKPLDSATEGE